LIYPYAILLTMQNGLSVGTALFAKQGFGKRKEYRTYGYKTAVCAPSNADQLEGYRNNLHTDTQNVK